MNITTSKSENWTEKNAVSYCPKLISKPVIKLEFKFQIPN